MTGKLTPKSDDTHRKHLKKRTADHIALVNKIVPKSMLKSPSQKHSEAAKKRERLRAGSYEKSCQKAASNLEFDCYTCSKFPCGTDPRACYEPMILERCAGCGLPVRHYHDVVIKWTHCPVCREKVKSKWPLMPPVRFQDVTQKSYTIRKPRQNARDIAKSISKTIHGICTSR